MEGWFWCWINNKCDGYNVKKFDTAILLSGDSDFAPIIKRMKENSKKVIIISAKHHISREIIELSDKYINLKKLRDKIEFLK